MPDAGSVESGSHPPRRYHLEGTLGEGGTGTVYRAWDNVELRNVAVKVLDADGSAAGLAEREFRLLASHNHPHVVRVFDYGRTETGDRYFTMELCRGRHLVAWATERLPKLSDERAASPLFVEVIRQILSALDHIHTRGMVHLDLKPENILVDDRGDSSVVKLIDFGLARSARSNEANVGGTAEYLAPERIRGEEAEPRSDLYALGIILYELLRGEPPFRGDTLAEVLRAHTEDEPLGVGELPAPFDAIVGLLLEKLPTSRPRSAHDVRAKLTTGDVSDDDSTATLPGFGSLLVHRDEVLARLEAKLAGGDERGAVVLDGPTGIGKTRVLRELQVRAQLRGLPLVSESCRHDGERPGGVIERLLQRLAANEPENSSLLARDRPLFTELEKSGTAGAYDGAAEGFVYRLTGLVLDIASERNVTLVVDDVQWADSLSLDALNYLRRSVETFERGSSPVSLVLAIRNDGEEDTRRIASFVDGPHKPSSSERITLEGFDADQVRSYLVDLLGDEDSFPGDYPAQLTHQTGGNPFFVEEYLKLRAQLGGIVRRGDGWRIDPNVEAPVPASIDELARRRLDTLDETQRAVLELAAVAGRPFDVGDLGHVPPMCAADGEFFSGDVRAVLYACARDHHLRRDGARFTFSHSALERAIYAGIEPDRQKRLHGRNALSLVDSAPDQIEQIAHHFYLSDTPEKAGTYLLDAGERAIRLGGMAEAQTHLSRALEVSLDAESHPAERFDALLRREKVWEPLGRVDERLADITELEQLAEKLGEPKRRCEVLVRRMGALRELGKKEEARHAADAALALVDQEGLPAPGFLSRIGIVRLFDSNGQDIALLERALVAARNDRDADVEARCLQLIGLAHYLRGDFSAALIEMEKALSLRRDMGDDSRAGALASNIGLIHLDRGQLESAEERFQGSLKEFRRAGVRRGEAVNLLNLGLVYHEMGRFERALDYINEALQIRRQVGHREGEASDLCNLALVWLRLGRYERAAERFEEALAIARETQNVQCESGSECGLGVVDIARGDVERGRERLVRSRAVEEKLGASAQRVCCLLELARLELDHGESKEALELATEALAIAEKGSMFGRRVEARTVQSAALLACERFEESVKTSEQAIGELEDFPGWLDRSQEIWFTHYRVLDAARNRGQKADGTDDALRRAYTLLKEKADALGDPELRQSFLESIPLHREIDRLHEELQRKTRRDASHRERSFYEIARSLHSILEIDPLLDRLLELAIQTTHAEKGLILLRGDDDTLTTRAARGMASESIEDATDICKSVIADVATGGEPVLATDASSDNRFRDRQSIISFQIRTLMCVPLKARDEVLGAVYVDGRGSASFSPDDLEYLESFGHLAAIAVDNARLLGKLKAENVYLRREMETRSRFENLIGRSRAMEDLADVIEKIARSDASVLITGETGTGKSVIARAVHFASERSSRPFVTVDCGALPENLLESELFGHKKGAFSGAIHDRVGLIEDAGGGTLFLDEITNTSLDLQVKLLRVLQEGELRRVGENQVRKVDVRVVVATNVDILQAIDEGTFREDLYYRLNVVPLAVPPLRERPDDIPLLAMHFLDKVRERSSGSTAVVGFTEEAMRLMETLPWKGNVRELENLVEKAVILCDDDRIDAEFLRGILPVRHDSSPTEATPHPPSPTPQARDDMTLEEFDRLWLDAERDYLVTVVDRAGWNLSAAGRLAGVRNRNTLVSRLKKHGIERPGDSSPNE